MFRSIELRVERRYEVQVKWCVDWKMIFTTTF